MATTMSANDLVGKARELAGGSDVAIPMEVWAVLHRDLLSPSIPIEIHEQCYQQVYASNNNSIAPSWIPNNNNNNNNKKTTNIEQAMIKNGFTSYHELYKWSVESRNDFWMQSMQTIGIKWDVPPLTAFEEGQDMATDMSYFPKGRFNISDSCLQFPSEQPAIVYATESAPRNVQTVSMGQLQSLVNQVANAITKLGLTHGDAVGICMPMTYEAVAIYLGIIKAGCVVVSIADSFSASEIATRCRLAKCRTIFTQDVIYRGTTKFLPLYDRVVLANEILMQQDDEDDLHDENKETKSDRGDDDQWLSSMNIICLAARQGKDLHESISLRPRLDMSFDDCIANCSDEFTSIKVDSMEPCNILFSSGTTGEPKAIVWSHSTPIKCAVDGYYHQDVHPGEVVCWPSNIGWMMGPWLIYQLINGATIALFNGVTSTAPFCEFVEASQVNMLGVIPSLVKAWQAQGATDGCDWSCITRFSSTGEASDAKNYLWLQSRVPGYAPVMEYCGGTEIGGSFLSSTMVQPNVPSMFSSPVLGSKFVLRSNADGDFVDDNEITTNLSVSGEICLVPPSVGLSTKLLNRSHYDTYYKGMGKGPNGEVLRRHGDEIEMVSSDKFSTSPYYRALGRCDDTMNIGGIKVSSVEIERVCNLLQVVQETAAIAVSRGGPCKLVIYAVVHESNDDVDKDALKKAMQLSIKTKLNPLFGISDVVITDKLPRTASNKVMRRLLRDGYLNKSMS